MGVTTCHTVEWVCSKAGFLVVWIDPNVLNEVFLLLKLKPGRFGFTWTLYRVGTVPSLFYQRSPSTYKRSYFLYKSNIELFCGKGPLI